MSLFLSELVELNICTRVYLVPLVLEECPHSIIASDSNLPLGLEDIYA